MATLIFVYNADSGVIANVSGSLKKLLAPKKYECDLCKVTHGVLSEKADWRVFLETLPYEKVFLHKDELDQDYETLKGVPLPAIFKMLENGNITTVATAEEIHQAASLEALKRLVREKLGLQAR